MGPKRFVSSPVKRAQPRVKSSSVGAKLQQRPPTKHNVPTTPPPTPPNRNTHFPGSLVIFITVVTHFENKTVWRVRRRTYRARWRRCFVSVDRCRWRPRAYTEAVTDVSRNSDRFPAARARDRRHGPDTRVFRRRFAAIRYVN